MFSASTFPLNKVVDTAAQRQSKLVWQSSGRNHLLYSNNSPFILEIRAAPGKTKRGETHFTRIFWSKNVTCSHWHPRLCAPCFSSDCRRKVTSLIFPEILLQLSQGEGQPLALSILGGWESSQAKCCQAELCGARVSK